MIPAPSDLSTGDAAFRLAQLDLPRHQPNLRQDDRPPATLPLPRPWP
jgi:hypothetical protein